MRFVLKIEYYCDDTQLKRTAAIEQNQLIWQWQQSCKDYKNEDNNTRSRKIYETLRVIIDGKGQNDSEVLLLLYNAFLFLVHPSCDVSEASFVVATYLKPFHSIAEFGKYLIYLMHSKPFQHYYMTLFLSYNMLTKLLQLHEDELWTQSIDLQLVQELLELFSESITNLLKKAAGQYESISSMNKALQIADSWMQTKLSLLRGIHALKQGYYDQAWSLLQQAKALYYNNDHYLQDYGKVIIFQGVEEEDINFLVLLGKIEEINVSNQGIDLAIRLQRDNNTEIQLLITQAFAMFYTKNFKKFEDLSLSALTSFNDRFPVKAIILNNLAIYYYQAKQFNIATLHLNAALSAGLNGKLNLSYLTSILYNIGITSMKKGYPAEGYFYFIQVATLEPNRWFQNPLFLLRLGECCIEFDVKSSRTYIPLSCVTVSTERCRRLVIK